ncbi:cysteine proteinase [Ramaria rubella]|nr:cysteine proteinase [Ramaria rubella]
MDDERPISSTKRQPLPTPTSSPTPDSRQSSTAAPVAPVPTTSFYADAPPPPPPRPSTTAGSAYTGYHYIPPGAPKPPSPPSYDTATTDAKWRSPELVQDPDVRDDDIPELVSAEPVGWGAGGASRGRSPTAYDLTSWAGGGTHDWVADAQAAQSAVPIDSCCSAEELSWWDAETRNRDARPGPGILPTLLAETLHDANHSLFWVSLTPPDLTPATPSTFQPPTRDEVLESVPHPNALYCRKENGWILLLVRSTPKLPPLAPSFRASHPDVRFSNEIRRGTSDSCLDENGDRPFGLANLTHHYHCYPSAVSSRSLNPPFAHAQWHSTPQTAPEADAILPAEENDKMEGIEPTTQPEDVLLSMYVCCQCSVSVLCSDVIPGIVPARFLEELVQERAANPTPGQSGADAAIHALDTTIKILENILWKNETRALPLAPGKSFVNKVGLSPAVLSLYRCLGFKTVDPEQTGPPSFSAKATMAPPKITTKNDRQRLLRAWVELSAWLHDYRKRFPSTTKTGSPWVTLENAREKYQQDIGAHPNQMVRHSLPGFPHEFSYPLDAIERLGFTPTAYSPGLLEFAYRAQCRCDPAATPSHFTDLNTLVTILRAATLPSPLQLDILIAGESHRGRWQSSELAHAAQLLGFGRTNVLKVELEESEDEFVKRAWGDAMGRAWRVTQDGAESDGDGGAVKRRDLTRALHIIAEARGSRVLKNMARDSKAEMTPEVAYRTLQVPEDVDEEMLITVYKMRVEDQPSQAERMQGALGVLAQWRDSERLRTFVQTGEDPGEAVQIFHPEWPRGLNQLGNTCYLNSLLQYFYTIKDLRDALTPLNVVDDVKLSDDDLKRHRVGGRLVTRKEILRSRKFVAALGNLFWELEYSDIPAITPDLELAKLALVTSKDEEEDEHGRTDVRTDSSASTDATLVDEPIPIGSTAAPASTPHASSSLPALSQSPSVLGKRQRARSAPSMDVDPVGELELDRDGFVMVPKPSSASEHRRTSSGTSNAKGEAADLASEKDVDMRDGATENKENKPPPLPPRRKPDVNTESVMMFGKQHDVAECMDNCMFQIETGLLRFDDMVGTDKDKISVVKRLFYGTIRQRISLLLDPGGRGSSIHEKEDAFSHLPVNVSEESFDIYDGLSGYFDDTVDFEGKKAKMEVSLVDLPPMLQIQLQRVQFNRETLQPYKSHAYVRFDETLYVDRFLDSADPAKRLRAKSVQAELSVCRDRIHALTRDKGAPFTETLSRTLDFLTNQDATPLSGVDDELLLHLETENDLLKAEISELREKTARLKEELELIWRDEKRAEYELTSVFVHRGSSASWGHYFFYSRCLPDRPDTWFKYNDSEVTQVRKDEVLADTTGSTANPYLLVYARRGLDMVHTVKRADLGSFPDA